MTALAWDQVGDRVFQTGVDHGVLYLPDNSGVPWNGLVSVTENSNREVKTFYLDGVKYLEHHVPGDFAAELKAFTYPDEFDEINGLSASDGVVFHDQAPSRFGLSYRTLIGDDVEGIERGYKIHVLYNLMANPSSIEYGSLADQTDPVVFGWSLTGTPVAIAGRRATCHISIDSTKIHPSLLAIFEERLYGSNDTEPSLPSIVELLTFDDITIFDNEDGTWTAVGPDELITMLDDTTFQITEANATYLDEDTYEISTSES